MANEGLIELREMRLSKIQDIKALGLNPYPSTSTRTHNISTIQDNFEIYQDKEATLAGRLMSLRKHGGMTFCTIMDQSGYIQLVLQKKRLASLNVEDNRLGYTELSYLDIGDIVEGTGVISKTQKGERSLFVDNLRLLSKSIRPLPDKHAGIKDREIIVRKRYLEVILDKEVKLRYMQIAKMISAARNYLENMGFIEIATPIIQPNYGGGTAKPFKTKINALQSTMYLAISHELYLKRLIVAGYEKVYTIGRYFRNEGIDRSHHPEFSMIETMTAYENYEYNMDLIEGLFKYIATKAFGTTNFLVRGNTIDLSKPWKRISMVDAVKENTSLDFSRCQTLEEANEYLGKVEIDQKCSSIGEALVVAFEECVEKNLINPTFVCDHPIEISPLAKPKNDDPRYAERFEIFIGGMECGDNWSEQNDPVRLLNTWRQYYDPENSESGEFHTLDFDFIEAIEYGMPPTTGIGPGIERLAMILTGSEQIDDVIFFPMRRQRITSANAEIFGIDGEDEENQ